ncbi:MAG: FliA/WhiG family RNA polymerase sigma factor [Bacillota bacterium]
MAIEVWRRYRDTRNSGLREQLIVEHLPLVRLIAGRLAVRPPSFIAQEDLEGWGIFGLIEAVEKYDPNHGTDFRTFAYHRIRGAILDEVRRQSWLPRSLWHKLQEINEVRARLERETGASVTDAEVAASLGMTDLEFHRLANHFRSVSVMSLDDVRPTRNGEAVPWGSLIEDTGSPDPLEQVLEEEDHQTLVAAITQLEEKDRLVLALYYQEGLTLKELGRVLEVTESRACQLHARAIARLREKIAQAVAEKGGRSGG